MDDRNIVLTSPGFPFGRQPWDPNLVTIADIGRMLGVSRQRADQLSRQAAFPDPFTETTAGRVWWDFDVVQWAADRGRTFDKLRVKIDNRWIVTSRTVVGIEAFSADLTG